MLLDSADVVVVGGGLVGVTTAHALKRRGFDVALVEQRFVAFGASGRNSGAIWVQTMPDGPNLTLARLGIQAYRTYAEELGDTFDFRQDGGLFFFETDAQAEVMRDYVQDRHQAGVRAEIISVGEARSLAASVPERAIGAVFSPDDAQVNTAKFTRAVADLCRRLGVRVYENTSALTLIRHPSGRAKGIRTVRGDIMAEGVIWSSGAWAANLTTEGIDLPITPVRVGMLVTQPVSTRGQIPAHGPLGVRDCGALTGLASFSDDLFTAPSSTSGLTYDDVVTQNADGNLLVGQSYDDAHSLNPHITMDATHLMLETVRQRRPDYGKLGVTGLWAGLVGLTADGLPIVDNIDGLYVNAGHAFGTSSGPVSGYLMAQLVSAESPTDFPLGAVAADRGSLQHAAT